MDFTDFTFRVLLIFLPGIITTVLVNRNTGTKDETSIQFFMRALMYGFISYYILMFVYFLLNIGIVIVDGFNSSSLLHLKFFEVMNDANAKMDFTEIFYVSLVSVIVACVKSSYENTIKMLNNVTGSIQNLESKPFAKVVNWYYKFWVKQNVFGPLGNRDVWNYLFTNLNHIITVRDWENEKAYIGTLSLCSPTHTNAELYLEDVTVIDMKGIEEDRELTGVYLCKDKAESWDIEFMYIDPKDAIKRYNLGKYAKHNSVNKTNIENENISRNDVSSENVNNVANETNGLHNKNTKSKKVNKNEVRKKN